MIALDRFDVTVCCSASLYFMSSIHLSNSNICFQQNFKFRIDKVASDLIIESAII
jgi:hypothetical protein